MLFHHHFIRKETLEALVQRLGSLTTAGIERPDIILLYQDVFQEGLPDISYSGETVESRFLSVGVVEEVTWAFFTMSAWDEPTTLIPNEVCLAEFDRVSELLFSACGPPAESIVFGVGANGVSLAQRAWATRPGCGFHLYLGEPDPMFGVELGVFFDSTFFTPYTTPVWEIPRISE